MKPYPTARPKTIQVIAINPKQSAGAVQREVRILTEVPAPGRIEDAIFLFPALFFALAIHL